MQLIISILYKNRSPSHQAKQFVPIVRSHQFSSRKKHAIKMSAFLRFTAIISFSLIAIVSSAKIPAKTHSMDSKKPAQTEFQFLIQLLCRINKLEEEAKEIQSSYVQLLHEGLHVPEDKVLALNLLADDLEDFEPEPTLSRPHSSTDDFDEPEPVLGKPHISTGADSWVRASVRPIDSFANKNATGKRSIPMNKNKLFSKFHFK